jgi:uncharacterized protein (DUF58 family)
MRSLTTRGRILLVLGLAGAIAGWLAAQPAILALALLLVLLPILGLLAVRGSRFDLGSSRAVSPGRIPFGSEAEVILTIENGSRLTSGTLLLEDTVPPALGESVRILLDRVPPRGHRSQRYPIHGVKRGREVVGPLTVTVTDPFGMAALERSFTSTNTVLVTPRVVPLTSAGSSRSAGGHGETVFRTLATRGDDDLLPREHRPGDDMRRIHWRATARQGELMVRREEQAWHSSVIVVLDDRARAHRGEGSASTFEWAVSAAASVALHYQRNGWLVTVLGGTGRVLVDAQAPSGSEVDTVLQALAEVRLVDAPMAVHLGLDAGDAAAVVAVLGELAPADVSRLSRAAAGFAGALVLEPAPVDILRAHGWRVATWTAETPVDEAWRRIAPSPTVAERTTVAR